MAAEETISERKVCVCVGEEEGEGHPAWQVEIYWTILLNSTGKILVSG